jgi:hypothetical protein
MTRKEFFNKFEDLTRQLSNLVNELPSIPELEDSLYTEEFEQSKKALDLDILGLELQADFISDKYFDQD